MEDWSVLDLAQDPVPGDPAQIQTLAARLLREAQHAEQHASRLGQVAANSVDLRMQGTTRRCSSSNLPNSRNRQPFWGRRTKAAAGRSSRTRRPLSRPRSSPAPR